MAVSIPRAGRIAILGTSLVQQNHIGGDGFVATAARGWMSWAEVLSFGRLSCPVYYDPAVVPGWEPSNRPGVSRFFTGLNFGVGGQKAIEIERRVSLVLEEDFDLIVLDAGTNDMMVETKETIAEIRARVASQLLDAGKTVVLLPILARGTQKWTAGGPERAKAHWINQMSLDFADRHANCHVFDWNAPWVDAESAMGLPHDGYSNDGTHFSVTGAFAVGKSLADYLGHIVPCAPARRLSPDDRFDPVHNPLGNLVAAPVQDLAVPSGASTTPLVGQVEHPGAGAWLRACCNIEVPADAGLLGLTLRLADKGEGGMASLALSPFRGEDGAYFPYPLESWSGMLRTPPLRLKPGVTPPEVSLDIIRADGAGTIAIKIAALELRQISNPVRL